MLFEVVKDLIRGEAQTLIRLSEASAYSFKSVHAIRHSLESVGVQNDLDARHGSVPEASNTIPAEPALNRIG